MVCVIVTVLVLTGSFLTTTFDFGATVAFGAGEQIDSTQRWAASAERGILALWDALGQLTAATTFFLAFTFAGFTAGLRAGFGFIGTGILMVLVMVCLVTDPAVELEEPTQTVTEPDPIFEPWLTPELDEPPLEHAVAIWESKPTRASATKMLAKPKPAC
jgi:hypothetical protein